MDLVLLTPDKTVFEGSTHSLQIPGFLGLMGLLNKHAPILSIMRPGILKFKSGSQTKSYCVSDGFFEFVDNNAVVLADAMEDPKDIDPKRAEKALQRAKRRLKDRKDIDVERAERALARALNRQRAYKSSH